MFVPGKTFQPGVMLAGKASVSIHKTCHNKVKIIDGTVEPAGVCTIKLFTAVIYGFS